MTQNSSSDTIPSTDLLLELGNCELSSENLNEYKLNWETWFFTLQCFNSGKNNRGIAPLIFFSSEVCYNLALGKKYKTWLSASKITASLNCVEYSDVFDVVK